MADYPITTENGPAILYCAKCGLATTRIDAMMRKFNTGYSACCNENLVIYKPRNVVKTGSGVS